MFVDALATGLVAGGLALAAPTATEVRELDAFDEVVWEAASELEVRLAGSGSHAGLRVASRVAEVSIGGSGVVRVAASERLKAGIAGSGELLYRGQPQIAQSITGAGSVRPTDE